MYLSEDEIETLWGLAELDIVWFARQIERFTENRLAKSQTPIGWLYDYKQSGEVFKDVFTDDFETIEFNCGYNLRPLYAAPVRTKDLTDDEIYPLYNEPTSDREAIEFARAVIAADREKNRG